MNTEEPALNSDLIAGVKAIAASLNESERRTYYMCEQHQIPAFKLGRRWYIRRSTLLKHIRKLEGDEAA